MASSAMKLRHLTIVVDTYVYGNPSPPPRRHPDTAASTRESLSMEEDFPLDRPVWMDSLLVLRELESF
jgi:hypothetical protein